MISFSQTENDYMEPHSVLYVKKALNEWFPLQTSKKHDNNIPFFNLRLNVISPLTLPTIENTFSSPKSSQQNSKPDSPNKVKIK